MSFTTPQYQPFVSYTNENFATTIKSNLCLPTHTDCCRPAARTDEDRFVLPQPDQQDNLPPSGLAIPTISKNKETVLQETLKQWDFGDPEKGLQIPLKDWPREWYTGVNKGLFGMKRYNRQLIAEEYKR